MKRAVPDTSVMAAITFSEPDADAWSARLEGAVLYAPTLLRYELQSVAWKKCRARPKESPRILRALEVALDPATRIIWMDPNPLDVVMMANATGLSAYDASFLCLAGMLEADLVTRDRALA
ncbi:MAG: type II toxin-antitoxin system VapC family toxin, partial [Rhodospirillaceae bacterium]